MKGVAERVRRCGRSGLVGAALALVVATFRESAKDFVTPRISRTGVAPFDALFPSGGLPLGHAVELCGEAASDELAVPVLAGSQAIQLQRFALAQGVVQVGGPDQQVRGHHPTVRVHAQSA